MVRQFDVVLPAEKARFLRSRQAANDLPFDFLSMVQYWTVVASLVMTVIFGILLGRGRRWNSRLAGFALVIIPAVIANAFVTGVFSTVEDRYQSRVVWLVVLLSGVLLMAWDSNRRGRIVLGSAASDAM
jgi:peptidoglycan/LPS O-acetylase OafA/YrhL